MGLISRVSSRTYRSSSNFQKNMNNSKIPMDYERNGVPLGLVLFFTESLKNDRNAMYKLNKIKLHRLISEAETEINNLEKMKQNGQKVPQAVFDKIKNKMQKIADLQKIIKK